MIDAIVFSRNGDEDAKEVEEVLRKHMDGSLSDFGDFNDNRVLNYITERKRQISVMMKFYERTVGQDTPQIGKYAMADIPRAMLSRQYVFVLSISVLPDLNLDDFDNYEIDSSKERFWYNNDEVVGIIR